MTPTRSSSRRERERNLLSPSSPRPWPAYPFVPVVRRTGEGEECGLPTDPAGLFGLSGYGPTVFPADPFDLPTTPAAFLARATPPRVRLGRRGLRRRVEGGLNRGGVV